jgi:hypothetical protein
VVAGSFDKEILDSLVASGEEGRSLLEPDNRTPETQGFKKGQRIFRGNGDMSEHGKNARGKRGHHSGPA